MRLRDARLSMWRSRWRAISPRLRPPRGPTYAWCIARCRRWIWTIWTSRWRSWAGGRARRAGRPAEVGVRVVAKETGAGVGYEAARDLAAAGVAAIDVGGAGGSSMAALETLRAESQGDERAAAIGRLYRDWGLATPIALVETRAAAPDLPVVATGGIRSGLDAARALALGATVVGVGYPFLRAASMGEDALRAYLPHLLDELRVAMQLTGAATIADLRRVPVVVTGATHEWLELRGLDGALRALARRGRAQPEPRHT